MVNPQREVTTLPPPLPPPCFLSLIGMRVSLAVEFCLLSYCIVFTWKVRRRRRRRRNTFCFVSFFPSEMSKEELQIKAVVLVL